MLWDVCAVCSSDSWTWEGLRAERWGLVINCYSGTETELADLNGSYAFLLWFNTLPNSQTHTLTRPAVSSTSDKGQRDFRTAAGHVVPPIVKCSDPLAASSAVTHMHKHTRLSLIKYTNLSVWILLNKAEIFHPKISDSSCSVSSEVYINTKSTCIVIYN